MLWYFFLFGKSCTCGWNIIFPWICLYELQPVTVPRKLCQCNAMLCKFCLGSYMLHVTGSEWLPEVKWWDYHLLHMVFSLSFFPKVTSVLFLFSVSFKIVITLSERCSVCIYVTHRVEDCELCAGDNSSGNSSKSFRLAYWESSVFCTAFLGRWLILLWLSNETAVYFSLSCLSL